MTTISAPLVGMFFRPPAKAVVANLPAGAELELRPEPTNAYDPHAVQVWFAFANLPAELHEPMQEALAQYGTTLEYLITQGEIFLGFIARTHSQEIAGLCRQPAEGGDWLVPHARLGFAADSKPLVLISAGETQ